MMNSNRTITVASKSTRQKFAPKKWSHQDELANAKGKMITLVFGREEYDYHLIDSDPFTLKVRSVDTQSILTYFKHALVGYIIKE